MRKPQQAPLIDPAELVAKLGPERFGEILTKALDSEAEGKYRHWDILRRLQAPPGFSHQEWWGATKLVRGVMEMIPLCDLHRRPFRYKITDTIAQRLHEIDRGAGGSVGVPGPVLNPQTRGQYVMRSLFQEALTSSQLEGAATTRAVAKEMIRSGRPPRTNGERMILNNYRTMQRIAEWKDRPLDLDLLFEIHRTITAGTLENSEAEGRLRTEEEKVAVEDERTGEICHHPPPAVTLPNRLAAMFTFANATTKKGEPPSRPFVHPVVRATLLHFWLGYDHPFVDGNGRTARALFYWSMLRQGYWLFEFVSISEILLKARVDYAEAFLYTETDDNDATYFLIHQSDVICRAIEALHQYIEKKSQEWESTEALLRNASGLNYRQQALIGHALRHPGSRYTVEGHSNSHGTVLHTARKDLLELTQLGWLGMTKIGRAFTFLAPADLADRVSRGTMR